MIDRSSAVKSFPVEIKLFTGGPFPAKVRPMFHRAGDWLIGSPVNSG